MIRIMPWISALVLLGVGIGAARGDDDGAASNLVPSAPLHETVLRLAGDPDRPVELEVTLFTPPGDGPFPLAVLNHGATAASANNRGARYRYTYSAYYFLSRGYAVALPMARGFAGSGGEIAHAGCALDEVGMDNARDVRSVIQALGRMPQIDPERIVVGGQSFGGWTTLALGTMSVPGVRGLIAFSPALRTSDCPTPDPSMIGGARRFGDDATLPSLWFYGDNDSVMPTITWTGVFDAYRDADGHRAAQPSLVRVGRFLADSHQMLSFEEGLPIWTPRVDAFLARIGLPAAEVHPEYLPIPTPPPSGFAGLSDVAAVPLLNDRGRASYAHFLALPVPRVFAIAANGTTSVSHGGFDPMARALKGCRDAGIVCRPYAIDDTVVWTGGVPPSEPHARVVAAGQPTRIAFGVNLNEDCSPQAPPSLRVVGQPVHGSVRLTQETGHPDFPPGSHLAACNAVTVSGVKIVYTPQAGYVGPDAMSFAVHRPDGSDRTIKMAVTVR